MNEARGGAQDIEASNAGAALEELEPGRMTGVVGKSEILHPARAAGTMKQISEGCGLDCICRRSRQTVEERVSRSVAEGLLVAHASCN